MPFGGGGFGHRPFFYARFARPALTQNVAKIDGSRGGFACSRRHLRTTNAQVAQGAEQADAGTGGDIVVTGSIIRGADVGPSPVSTITAENLDGMGKLLEGLQEMREEG